MSAIFRSFGDLFVRVELSPGITLPPTDESSVQKLERVWIGNQSGGRAFFGMLDEIAFSELVWDLQSALK